MSGSLPVAIHNERVRLRVALLDAAAASCFTVSVAAPIAAGVFYGIGPSIPLRAVGVGVIFWSGAMMLLHGAAWRARLGA